MRNKRFLMPVKKNAERRVVIELAGARVFGALTTGGEPVEFMSANTERGSAVGNIYAAKVVSVSANGFAFVDAGLGRHAFLNLNDHRDTGAMSAIKPGAAVAVQVLKDAVGGKGAYVTTKLSWAGRYFVLELGGEPVSVSKKITAQSERDRLTAITSDILKNRGAEGKRVTVRTEAANCAPSFLEAELNRMIAEAEETESAYQAASTLPSVVYKPYAGVFHMVAAELMAGASYAASEIIVNNKTAREELAALYEPKGVSVVFTEDRPFARYNLEKALESTKERRVGLPGGAWITIERTEACVVIDVNSGGYSGRKVLEDMAYKINTDAAREAARQLRLRNLSGAVLIDFIRMDGQDHIESLIGTLSDTLAADKAVTTVEGFTKLGFAEVTRKRSRPPLWS